MALTTWLFLVGTLIGCLSGSTALELRDVVTLAERLAKDRLWAGMYIVTKGKSVEQVSTYDAQEASHVAAG